MSNFYIHTLSLHDALPIFRSLGDQERLKLPGAARRLYEGADGLLAHREHARLHAQGPCDLSLGPGARPALRDERDRKSTRLNSSHLVFSYAVFCFKKKNNF